MNKLRTANAAKEEMAAQVPASLKAISSYLKTALEYDKRDPVVAYYCKYALKYSHAIARYACAAVRQGFQPRKL